MATSQIYRDARSFLACAGSSKQLSSATITQAQHKIWAVFKLAQCLAVNKSHMLEVTSALIETDWSKQDVKTWIHLLFMLPKCCWFHMKVQACLNDVICKLNYAWYHWVIFAFCLISHLLSPTLRLYILQLTAIRQKYTWPNVALISRNVCIISSLLLFTA